MTRRWWPTVEMLDAGIEVFMAEWRPIGVEPGDIPREPLEEFVFHFFGPLLAPRGGVDPLTHTSGMIASAERDRLGLRPSPDAHRRHLAERLNDIVHRLPVPNPIVPHARAVVVTSTTEFAGPPALDPEGVCARCRAFGTVARVTMGYPPRSTRFCASCWREVRSSYMSPAAPEPPRTAREQIAFMDRLQEPPQSVKSRSWDDAIDFVNLIMTARDDPKERGKITSAMLAELAAEISTEAEKMNGPMPPEIETFIREFGAP
jgi:hypothetical protein